jgi:small subunit ribosomal protein S17
MLELNDIKALEKKANKTYKEFINNSDNLVYVRRLSYEIGCIQKAIENKLDDNRISEDEYDKLLDIIFKWNSLISLRNLPADIFYFPSNQFKLKRNSRKIIYGVVTSNKMQKTSVILVTRKIKHSIYKKFITKTKKFKIHDENNELNIGDYVSAMECRPLSKGKRFRLLKIIERVK